MNKKNKPKNKRKHSTNNKSNESKIRTFFVRAIAVWIFILPLIVHIKIVDVPIQMQDLYLTEQAVDFFAYWKAIWLCTGAIIFFTSAIIFKLKYKISFKPTGQIWALIAFAVTIIISFIFSDAKNVAWVGYLDRYEGTLSWLSYCMAGYAVHAFTNNKEHNITIIKGIVLSAGIVGLIGALQFFGMDFFKTEFAKVLMLGSKYSTMAKNLDFTMPVGQSYSTLYNPNYIGSFVAITLPLVAYMVKEAKNNIWRVLYSVISILLIISLIGSKSTAGLVAVVIVAVVGMAIFAIKSNIKTFYKISVAVVVLIAIIASLMLPYTQAQMNKITKQFTQNPNPNYFKSVEVVGKDVIITTDKYQTITISPHGDIIQVKDQAGNVLQGEEREKYYLIPTSNLSKGSSIILYYETRIVDIVYYKNLEQKKYSRIRFDYFPQLSEFSVLKRSLSQNNTNYIQLFKNEKNLSNRGYIWNHTLPQIIKKPIFGYGADTFALYYPQVDLLNKRHNMVDHRMIVDKVHNTYMQIAINFGVISPLFFIFILLLKRLKNWYSLLVALGCLITGIINDSILATTTLVIIVAFLDTPKEVATEQSDDYDADIC